MLKLITLVGTRPELIKLSSVIKAADRAFEHTLVHTGQNHDFELSDVFFRDLGIREPDYFLDAACESAAKTIARTIEAFDDVLAKTKPDAMLLLGDTNSGLAAIAAKRRKIPIFHMEAGNRCFDERVPEEINRRIIDHTSDINLVYTEHARRHLLAEGVRADSIIKTGSPMREILREAEKGIDASKALDDLGLSPGSYFLVSAHREENVDARDRLEMLVEALLELGRKFDKRIMFSVHPRTRARLRDYGLDAKEEIQYLAPLGFFDYVKLQCNAFCVVSDSGTLTEESSLLGFPAIMIREAHERPEGMDQGAVIMTGLRSDRMVEAVSLLKSRVQMTVTMPADYEPLNVSAKVVRIIQSYVDYVDRTVWHKH